MAKRSGMKKAVKRTARRKASPKRKIIRRRGVRRMRARCARPSACPRYNARHGGNFFDGLKKGLTGAIKVLAPVIPFII